MSEKFNLPKVYIKFLVTMLDHITQFLTEHDITYWVDGGTMLGSIRNEKHIPYDDDEDIGIMYKDYNKLVKLLPLIQQFGYSTTLSPDPYCIKVYLPLKPTLYNGNVIVPSPTLDIFVYCIRNKYLKTIVLKSDSLRECYPNAKHKYDDLFPLKDYKYSNLKLKGPNNPFPYLDTSYPDWRNRIVIDKRLEDYSKVTFEFDMDKKDSI